MSLNLEGAGLRSMGRASVGPADFHNKSTKTSLIKVGGACDMANANALCASTLTDCFSVLNYYLDFYGEIFIFLIFLTFLMFFFLF